MISMEAQCREYAAKLKATPYVSIVPSRRPVVKVHRTLGLAKIAVAYGVTYFDPSTRSVREKVRGGEIHQQVGERWELLYRVEADTPAAEMPWKKESK
jgi:hypothetical protein